MSTTMLSMEAVEHAEAVIEKPVPCRPFVNAAFLRDPYPLYRELREAGPIHWSEEFSGGAWLLTRHEDVEAVLRDPSTRRGARVAG
ncbi:hypothetical protein ACU4GI_46615 (plasmid) [Cupriavidus basilensis]